MIYAHLLILLLGCPLITDTDTDEDCPDTDEDSVCDDQDLCVGDDASGDADADGVCDAEDACQGLNSSGDTDNDGACDDIDPCPMDSPDDTDGDGICDSVDVCPKDEFDDSDGDGICDSEDRCPGATDETNGTCTMVLPALRGIEDWSSVYTRNNDAICPVYQDIVGEGHGSETLSLYSTTRNGIPDEMRLALSFNTKLLDGITEVNESSLVLNHVSIQDENLPIELWGGSQPLLDPIIDNVREIFLAGTELLDTVEMHAIIAAGEAKFSVPRAQILTTANTGFILQIGANCPLPTTTWQFTTPDGDPSDVPTLTINYFP